jgi:hypothetical protein
MKRFSCITILPIGPRAVPEFSLDTIASVFRYSSSNKLIILDDTITGHDYNHLSGRADVLRCQNDGSYSVTGRLYKNVSRAIEYALDTYDFDVVLRLDDDALIIGSGFEAAAAAMFEDHPNIGLLGSYKITCMGHVRDFSPPAELLEREISLSGALAHPARWCVLRRLVKLAERNGYQRGENCLGAACFFRKKTLCDARALGLLSRNDLGASSLGDDHIFPLIVFACGYSLGDYATDGLPLGLAWQGLPTSPADLIAMNKQIIHSVRYYQDLDQRSVRREFAKLLDYPPAV